MRVDPIAKVGRWHAAACRAGAPLADAMALATVGRGGAPSVRFVLLKGVEPRGFVFFTDTHSRKGRELAARPRASLAFYWDATGKQVRVEGRIERVTAAEADAYWATRPRGSRLAASVSLQSQPMPSHAWLLARWRRLRHELGGRAVPRPARWGGFRLVPASIEFWTRGAHRLHLREAYVRGRRGWRRRLLQP
ncbi:MAG TPA: pyridoxamine 5'-phosphate oxidase [Candidatus Eisenbacteria bacterium]|nr:pyridoxamine 5'-phosphate oxidase [Candidatus Eisenbacteria bacterium]